jgi:hypothetical protein
VTRLKINNSMLVGRKYQTINKRCLKRMGNKRPKLICSPSYEDIRSRVNTTRGLDFDHMIKRG